MDCVCVPFLDLVICLRLCETACSSRLGFFVVLVYLVSLLLWPKLLDCVLGCSVMNVTLSLRDSFLMCLFVFALLMIFSHCLSCPTTL